MPDATLSRSAYDRFHGDDDAQEVCVCGHVEDEHEDNGTCSIEGCLCAGFEPEDEETVNSIWRSGND